MKKIIYILLCLLVLCGCVKQNYQDQPQPTFNTVATEDVTQSATHCIEPATEPTVETTTAPETKPVAGTTTPPATEPSETVESTTEPVVYPTETAPPETTDPTIPETTTPPTTLPEKSLEELIKDGTYMLCREFEFYKGSVSMSEIQTISFSRTTPSNYDECWSANVAKTNDIMGYRIGADVIIVGEHIYVHSDGRYMFAAHDTFGGALWSNLMSVNGLELLNTSYTRDISYMFFGGKFTSLHGLEYWNVGSVNEMKCTFAECTNITTLNIGSWNVSSVTNFSGMFQGHDHVGDMKLQHLDIGSWNTSSALSMSHMFYGCGTLTYIPVENWNVSRVGSFSHMFADCFSLQSIDFSNWETLSARSFDAFLNDCRSLTSIDVSGLDTATCIQFSQMFEACTNLQYIIGLDTWDVSSANDYAFSETFHCCYSLKELDLSSWHATPDNTARMFKNCYSLETVDMSGFNMYSIQHVTEMFMGCSCLLEIIGTEEWNLENVNGFDSMYDGTIFEK